MRTSRNAQQQGFEFRTWGGVRRGAGPKLQRPKPGVPHRPRATLRPYQPVHVTMRVLEHVWNLRSQRSFAIVHRAVVAIRRRKDFRIVHFCTLGNHIHLIVEADGPRALATGMLALSIRIARGLNAMMGRNGPVYEDRYHAHVLKTPGEVENAIRYVLGNFASHARRRGATVSDGFVDPFSSAAPTQPRDVQASLWPEAATTAPSTWLLRRAASCGEDALAT